MHYLRTRRLVGILAIVAALAACRPSGAPAGSPCSNAFDCSSRLCELFSTGQRCVDTCTTTSDCPTGQVCGAVNFGGVDPESGTFDDGGDEVLHVCRERLSPACSDAVPCASALEGCVGTTAGVGGVCAAHCRSDSECDSTLCLGASSALCGGPPGVCVPLCDDGSECPTGWYCNQGGAPQSGHGRCDPINPIATDASSSGVCVDASSNDF